MEGEEWINVGSREKFFKTMSNVHYGAAILFENIFKLFLQGLSNFVAGIHEKYTV